jgi:GTPase SAR1 family protein
LGGTVVWGAIALGSGLWWLKKQNQPVDLPLTQQQPVNQATVEQELATVEQLLNQFAEEFVAGDAEATIARFRDQLSRLRADATRKQLRFSIMGGKAVGKTTLAHRLAASWATPSASPATVPTQKADTGLGVELGASDCANVNMADLVLFVTTGDLTDPEFQTLERLLSQQRLLLVFNKQDLYLPAEQPLILQQLRDRLNPSLAAEDVVAIAAQPAPVKIRQHQPDGSIQERLEQPLPDLASLTERLKKLCLEEGQQLVWATNLRQIRALKAEIRTALNQIRRGRALALIEQSQWIAATTAFANPVPSLDLLATAAIQTQLVVDLSAIYQQSFSLQQAKAAAGAMAELMVKLGFVELSSQAIAPLLKSHALTYVAGGLLQGVSAAYLTRVAGLSLVEYFQEQSQLGTQPTGAAFQLDRLTQKLKAVFQECNRTAFLQTLVKQGINRLRPETVPAQS